MCVFLCVCLIYEQDVTPSAVASILSCVLKRVYVCVYLTDEHDVSPPAVASVLSCVLNRVYVCVYLTDEQGDLHEPWRLYHLEY